MIHKALALVVGGALLATAVSRAVRGRSWLVDALLAVVVFTGVMV